MLTQWRPPHLKEQLAKDWYLEEMLQPQAWTPHFQWVEPLQKAKLQLVSRV